MMNWIQLLSDRRADEQPAQRGQLRSRFEQDYDRIIFSYPFRMLQDKTQVFPLPKQDFVHTRLTHSLEVASVGRSLGKLAGGILIEKHPEIKDIGFTSHDFGVIVSAASLMHDLGNPPFGHAGESAISDYFHSSEASLRHHVSEKEWADLINFEGNAQGFRLVNKRNFQGLKLTFATLGTFSKYPRESVISNPEKWRKSQKKYGFYQSNKSFFNELADDTGLLRLNPVSGASWCRHPLTFLVEAADDICYNIIDLEDGTNLGLVSMDESKSLLAEIIGKEYKEEKFTKIESNRERISTLRALAIRSLIQQCVDAFMAKENDMLCGHFDAAITDNIPSSHTLKKIQTLSMEKIYKSMPVIEREVAGFEVIHGLLNAFIPSVISRNVIKSKNWHHDSLLRLLSADYRLEIQQAETPYENLRVVLDYISGLTDSHALALYRNIKGITLPHL
jgi:dGTPase